MYLRVRVEGIWAFHAKKRLPVMTSLPVRGVKFLKLLKFLKFLKGVKFLKFLTGVKFP